VAHVVEFKTARPAPSLEGLDAIFAAQVRHANEILAQWNACLMPSAMHPWMNPATETHLWPHDCNEIYEQFNRIFDCRGHGWANLQSMHINLPFADNGEFHRLHTAIRTVLPLLPALAASSPALDGECTAFMDNRVRVYSGNCARVPEIAGMIVPEPVASRHGYEASILVPIYRVLKPLDPEGILCHEWANARGAIARFDRGTIEIRLLDIQECPAADLAIATLVCAVVQAVATERFSTVEQQDALSTEALYAVLMDASRNGDTALLDYPPLTRCLGINEQRQPMGEVWQQLAVACLPADSAAIPALNTIFQEGCLARRICDVVHEESAASLFTVYRELCRCLTENRMFVS
jgi:gamma-glutamyl:cysteine ligase YbdK (ATP-grasp superfamily)